MNLVLPVSDLDSLRERLKHAIDQPDERAGNTRVRAATFFSGTFMQRHTQFDSFEAFCEASPCDGNGMGDFQDMPVDKQDDFVTRVTEFEDWAEMKHTAAVENVVDNVHL